MKKMHEWTVRFLLSAAAVTMPAAAAAAAQPLSLNGAVDLALTRQPALTAYERTADAAAEAAVAARQLPDPELVLAVRNLPVTGGGAFSFDTAMMTMKSIGIERRQVRGEKRNAAAARLRAEGAVSLAEQELLARRIRREVMLSWASIIEAQQSRRLYEDLTDKLNARRQAIEARIATGGAAAADAIAIRAEISSIRGQSLAEQSKEEAARAELARWIGAAAGRELEPALPVCRPASRQEAEAELPDHPLLGVEDARITVADRATDVARADRLPDWGWSAMYGQRNNLGDLFTLQVSIELPFNKDKLQNRRIAEASFLAAAAQDRRQDTRRMLEAAFSQSWAEWDAAEARLTATVRETLPALRGAEQALEARFAAGGGNLENVQVASERTTDAAVQAVAERAALSRATAELLYYTGECTA